MSYLIRPSIYIYGLLILILMSGCSSLPERGSANEVATDSAVLPAEWSARLQADIAAIALPKGKATTLWQGFDDADLQQLVVQSLTGNPQIRAAKARILEADANLRLRGARQQPVLSSSAGAQRERISASGPGPQSSIPGFALTTNAFSLGLRASWEPDLWGRTALAIESADYLRMAAQAEARGLSLSLQSETARIYINLRAAQMQQALLEQKMRLVERSIRLTEKLVDRSLAPQLDLLQAETRLSDLRVQLNAIESQVVTLGYALATVTGQAPASVDLLVTASGAVPKYHAGIPAGLPSDLLLQRPDIITARARLIAARADANLEDKNYLPSFSLTGEAGLLSSTLDSLISSNAQRGLVGAALGWPLFNNGRLQAQRDGASARVVAAEANYDQTILTSLNDVETAFERYLSANRNKNSLLALRAQLQKMLELAELRYQKGLENMFFVINARADVLSAESRLVDIHATLALSLVSINTALGGYWH